MPLAACRRSASWRPRWLGTYSSSAAAWATLCWVAGLTIWGSRSALLTVAIETPALLATSLIVGRIASYLPSGAAGCRTV